MDKITIKGAREHNLKNISLEIPKNKLVVMTGISGSGKSSLAFDTIYAEGQRRYVESLSAYARQFLGIMDKPDVDLIEGLSPAISIDQKSSSHNPRSTVGTITEIYDYLRLIFARIGHPHCPNCHIEISKLSLDEIVDKIINEIKSALATDKIKPHRFAILSPVVRQKKGEFKDLFDNLQAKGFKDLIVDGKKISLGSDISLLKNNRHDVNVVVDFISLTAKEMKNPIFLSNIRSRLNASVETGLNLSDGLVVLDADDHTRLFSEKFSCPNCNLSLPEIEPRMFSFNSPLGACDKCHGIGTIYQVEPDLILNPSLSINEGGILPFNKSFFNETWYARLIRTVAEEEDVPLDTPIKDLQKKQVDTLLYGTGKVYRVYGQNRFGRETAIFEKYDGLVKELERRYYENQEGFYDWQKYLREKICPKCHGSRLKEEILAITIDSKNINQFADLTVIELAKLLQEKILSKINDYEGQIANPIIKEIITRLDFLKDVGLGYLTVSRPAKTLSGGELQRIRLASQIGTGLTGVLYVLDEPSIGLHPKDVSSLINTLKKLRDLGNSILVVEHDRETIESADYAVELGPKAGNYGGQLIFSGEIKKMTEDPKSLTGLYLSGKKKIQSNRQEFSRNKGLLTISGVKENNLKNITAKFPLGNLIAVTGVSGSGKSTLVIDTLYPALKYYIDGYFYEKMGKFDSLEGYQYLDRVYLVDQSPIGRTPRSNPVTYIGVFDDIREVFAETVDAKARGFKKGRFSFNVKGGRCEKCQGAGILKIEMQFLSDVYIKCDVCDGKRYNKETLEIRYKGKTIYDILKMTVDTAVDFFRNHHEIYRRLLLLQQVGLGYIELGQSAPTLSGGEAQRIKLAHELSKKDTGRTVYILDEPTTGLHFYDIEKLISILYRLTEKGNTVIVIEHNLDVIKNCQYIVDLGPDGGDAGGQIVYQGEAADVTDCQRSHTGKYLKNSI
ncbi:excinuclease ABC subunit UvrA [Candidatus Roizmanbacteria bacterium]|nr:excinuclease ABC subunit UvrA [Candidatus Roizmanbacteria bacterium]